MMYTHVIQNDDAIYKGFTRYLLKDDCSRSVD